jgi:tetratricopeptide (TPR) repeat protein
MNMNHGMLAISLVGLTMLGALPSTAQHREHDPRALATDPLHTELPIAPLLDGLGEHHRPITTGSERAQRFFDQGLKLTYAFNHQEALRAFKEAVRSDPDAAMAYWGWALVLGPNLNLPMQDDVANQAYEAIQTAVALSSAVTSKERALIEALACRYDTAGSGSDRGALDEAYADAMGELYREDPSDTDVATLYAAALMNLSPWDYWTPDGQPREGTGKFLSVLEGVLDLDPHHEGALHYYIHAVEATDPKRAEGAADALRGLAPGAGHLVHMPSHIYMQTGRYAEAFEANRKAILADEGYLTSCRAQGIYPLTYYPHDIHFLAWAAILQGRSEEAIRASRKVASNVPQEMHHTNHWALYQTFLAMPLYTLTRFGKWDEILAEPKPRHDARYTIGIWHYARGMAYVHRNELERAATELVVMRELENDAETKETLIGYANAEKLLNIASSVLSGELEAKRGNFDVAVAHLERAVRLEDSLLYNEPPDWYYPVRHTLGAVLLEAGRAEAAEVVFWQDLSKFPDNGYALYGLAESLAAQGKPEEAKRLEERFRKAWAEADVPLSSSRL